MVSAQALPPELGPKLTEAPRAPFFVAQGVCLSLNGRVILDDVSIEVRRGEVLGLLGPNGSGKTSLLRCLAGVSRPDRGVTTLDGVDLQRHRAARAKTGVVFQDPSLDRHLSARENLVLGAKLMCVPKREVGIRADDLLSFMELSERAHDPVKQLSGGMARRLEIARALIHRPDLLLLDEPSNGLDPIALEKVWQRLLILRQHHDLTLLVSTHRADEAEQCDRLVVLDRGRVVTVATPDALLRKVSGDILVIEADDPEDLVQGLREMELHAEVAGDRVLVEHEEGHTLIPRLVECFPPRRFRSIGLRRPSLADAFFKLTGHGLTETSP